MVNLTEYMEEIKSGDYKKHLMDRCLFKEGQVWELDDFGSLKKKWDWEDFKKIIPDGEHLKHNHLGQLFIEYQQHKHWRCPCSTKIRHSEETIGEKPTNIRDECTFCGNVFPLNQIKSELRE